jgi:hypothetical protein
MLRRIHVNQHVIKSNRKTGANDAPLTVKSYKGNLLAHEVEVLDKAGEVVARVVYRSDKPLDCGAHVWIETTQEVRVK